MVDYNKEVPMSDSEWLDLESEKSQFNDWTVVFLKHNAWAINFYRLTKWKWWARYVVGVEALQYHSTKKHLGGNPYNSILADHLNEIQTILQRNLNLAPDTIKIEDFGNTNGFDIFNATSFPAFGINYLSVNSGVFYHTHTLVRTLQPFLIERRLPGIMKRMLIRNFTKSAVGLLSCDHTRSFQGIRLIPVDDGLLDGIEKFIIAHEMYHLAYRDNPAIVNLFSQYYSPELCSLCKDNEEVGADGLGVIVLYYHQKQTGSGIMMYSPCFLFKLLKLFDEIMGVKANAEDPHPDNHTRHTYLAKMLNDLKVKINVEDLDKKMESVVLSRGKRIKSRVLRILEKRKRLIEVYREMLSVVCTEPQE